MKAQRNAAGRGWALAVVLAVAWRVQAAAPNPAGHWEGTLKLPNAELAMVVDLERASDGAWIGELDLAEQIADLPLAGVKVAGLAVSFTARYAPGSPTFEAKLAEDGKTMTGTFTQGPATGTFELKRTSDAKMSPRQPANTGEVGVLAGIWFGTIETPQAQLRMQMVFVKGADGILTGNIVSVDQGGAEIPIASIARAGDTVRLDVKIIRAFYEGTLSKDGTTMTGKWNQGGAALGLTVERKK